MWHYRFLLLFVFLTASLLLAAQEEGVSLWIDDWETLAADDEEADWEAELEELAQHISEPLDLNTATREQLRRFPFLSDSQIEELLAYVYLHGPMETTAELLLIPELDKRTIELLRPFVCVGKQESERRFPALKNILKHGRHELQTRFDQPFYTREGYKTQYQGTKHYHSMRYKFRYGDYLELGMTGEKDAGEPFFALHEGQGYDHYSGYLQLKHLGRLENLTLGSYRLGFGQGLVLGNAFRPGKTFSLAMADARATGIRRHASTDEYNYLFGVAGTVRLADSFRLSAFASDRLMDGTLTADTLTSIDKAGLHRTLKETAKRNSFHMRLAGGRLSYDKNAFRVGVTGIYYAFSHPYEPARRTYAKYSLHGSRFYNVGLDYSYARRRWSFSGEAAKGTRGYAVLNKLGYRLSRDYRLLLVHRYYAHDYWAFYARSFGDGSAVQNENGWYMAAEASPWARWRLFAAVDMFSSPWWKYRISKPSQGVDVLLQAAYRPWRGVNMTLNYRWKRKERDVTGTSGSLTLPTRHHRLRYRLNLEGDRWQARTTMDYNRFVQHGGTGVSQGCMATQMLAYAWVRPSLSLSLQGSYFHTDDYDSRVYAYERGLLNTFYTPSFYGRGFRYTAHVRYDLHRHFLLLLKFGQTLYQDRATISSGNDQISSNRKSDLQLQVRITF